MATLSRTQEQGFHLYRKSDTMVMPKVTYSQYGGACYEDDGYDDIDAEAIVAMLKNQIDQGQGGFFREVAGFSIASGVRPVSQELHDKWLNEPMPPEDMEAKEKYYKPRKVEPKVNVARVVPKIMDTPKPYVPPKRYTIEEDCIEVERLIGIIESVDNMEIIRTPESVERIAGWIREDEHIHYRYKRPISCEQVRGILEEFQQ